MIFGILLFVFIFVCVFLCLLILIQSDKGGGISGAIGGLSGANNFLGTQDTANVLTKGTYVFGGVFLLLCVLMTFFAPGGGSIAKSEMQRRAEKAQTITSMPVSGSAMDFVDDESAGTDNPGVIQRDAAPARDAAPVEAAE
jgi:preprotein translocase subunit SecG